MRRCPLAGDMIHQLDRENSVDPLIISERWVQSGSTNWFPDKLSTTAIWVVNSRKVLVQEKGFGRGFVRIKINGVTYISVYLTPNELKKDFLSKINSLKDTVRHITGEIVIAGDFNASAVEWGMPKTDARGDKILDLSAWVFSYLFSLPASFPSCRVASEAAPALLLFFVSHFSSFCGSYIFSGV